MAEFRKSESENVFNGGATTSGHMDKLRLRLDSGRRLCLGSMPHESSDCSVDGLYGDKVVGAELRKSEKERECFQWRHDNRWAYGQMEATVGFSASNGSMEPLS